MSKKGDIINTKNIYYMIFGQEKIRIKPDIFEKYSSKFSEEYPLHPNSMEFKENVVREAFLQFVSSCQMRPIIIQPDYVQELITISRIWGVPTLEQQCYEFCKNNGIYFRPKYDPIGILLEHMDQETETVEDLIEVSKILNESFDDDRIDDIDPELLFRIIIISENNKTLNFNKFKNFIFKLLKTSPNLAAILSLRLNFNDLTEEEIEKLFSLNEFREQSIGFFFSNSLNQIKKLCEEKLFEIEFKNNNELDLFRRIINFEKNKVFYELINFQQNSIKNIENRLNKQKLELNHLFTILYEESLILDKGPLSPDGLVDIRLINLKKNCIQKLKEIDNNVNNYLFNKDNLHESLEKSVRYSEKQWKSSFANVEIIKKLTLEKINEVEKQDLNCNKSLNQLNNEFNQIKGVLISKILKDKLKFDKGLRDSTNRFELFNQNDLPLNINKEIVEKGEILIEKLEEKLDKVCPVRSH